MNDINTINNTNVNDIKTLDKVINTISNGIRNTSAYVYNTLETKQIEVSIKGYGISIGKQSNGSYGIAILMGDKRKEFTFKSIVDALKAFKDYILSAWSAGKATVVAA